LSEVCIVKLSRFRGSLQMEPLLSAALEQALRTQGPEKCAASGVNVMLERFSSARGRNHGEIYPKTRFRAIMIPRINGK
jgi:hypothetical protein